MDCFYQLIVVSDVEEKKKDVIRKTDAESIRLAKTLVRSARHGAIAFLDPNTGAPSINRVGVATDLDGTPLILVSMLSAHTPAILADLATRAIGKPLLPVMLLAGPKLRAVPVTIHIALSAVPAALTTELILDTCRITHADLRDRFGIVAPRLAVSGLNPHAGENGTMGREDDAVIRPAIAALQAEGIDARGPLPADTMFHDAARATYDVAICMYHDQALIPAKALGFDDSVNATLGLPFIRTSPDHGTAFSLAGTGAAKADSLIAALRLAGELAATSKKEG